MRERAADRRNEIAADRRNEIAALQLPGIRLI